MKKEWREISVFTIRSAAEVVSNKLIELGSAGTIFEDDSEAIDYCRVIAYYPHSSHIEELIKEIRHYLDELQQLGENVGNVEIQSKSVDDRDWRSNWKQYFKPTRVGKHLIVKPSWETFESQSDDLVIEIDPGMAFGSGLHASTRLALTLIESYLHPGNYVLDVGVGSGILSIAAARLGAGYVLGIDVDPDAVAIARKNVHNNSRITQHEQALQERIEIRVGSLDSLKSPRQFDCIIMNIRPNIILSLVPYAATYLRTGAALIISGILEEEGSELMHEIRSFGFIAQNHLTEDGWIAYILSQV